jgi:2-polyprenyl-3-methyl-5-hydroxy-6-metoxy-1,4-benzoquinol methylase
MTVQYDPEGTEIAALHEMVDLAARRVLEVGCGNGRLTWRYAGVAAQVTAIDGDEEDIATALADRPPGLRDRVELLVSSFQDYVLAASQPRFDVAILSWSL